MRKKNLLHFLKKTNGMMFLVKFNFLTDFSVPVNYLNVYNTEEEEHLDLSLEDYKETCVCTVYMQDHI